MVKVWKKVITVSTFIYPWGLDRMSLSRVAFFFFLGGGCCFSFFQVGGGGGGAGGQSAPPETSDRDISADLPGKKRQGKKRKGVNIERKRRKIV